MTSNGKQLIIEAYNKIGLDISKIALAIIAFFYASGYLVQAITLRNYGVHQLDSVKLQYIEVGFTFSVILLLVTSVPILLFMAHFGIRKRSNLPNYKIGASGFFLNTFNLFCLALCFALFITSYEWNYIAPIFNTKHYITISNAFITYSIIAVAVLLGMPLFERFVVRKQVYVKQIYWFIIEPLRYGAVVLGIVFDVLLIYTFPWISTLLLKGLIFVAAAMLVLGFGYVIVFYILKLGDEKSIHVLGGAATIGMFFIMYICINAYVFSIIRHIPMNRGGKLPLTRAYLASKCDEMKNLPIKKIKKRNYIFIGPAYILEETNDYICIVRENQQDWFSEWPTTFSLKKDEILFIKSTRIEDAGPRGY